MGAQRGLDLAELDAEAADLHLVIDPSEELQRAVGPPARPISRAVEPAPGRTVQVRYERRGGPPRLAQVPPRERIAADVELARHARRPRLARGIEHVDPGVRDRPPDRHGLAHIIGPPHLVTRGCRRRLGGAIAVDQPQTGTGRHHARRVRWGHDVAADHELSNTAQIRRPLLGQEVEHRRRSAAVVMPCGRGRAELVDRERPGGRRPAGSHPGGRPQLSWSAHTVAPASKSRHLARAHRYTPLPEDDRRGGPPRPFAVPRRPRCQH